MMFVFAACICMIMFAVGCSSTSTPEGTVKKAMKCLQNKDYEGYVDLIKFKTDDPDKLKAQKAQIVSILQDKGTKDFEAKGGIKDYEIKPAKIEGDKAEVETIITYGNGDTKKQEFKLVKNEDGNWNLEAGK